MRKKIAFVCQRYGSDVNGGSEQYCRQIAERLVPYYDVTVYTTCAKDYISWENEYKSGIEVLNSVTVKRFEVSRIRRRYYSALVGKLLRFFPHHDVKLDWHWIDLQGPLCPQLVEAIKSESSDYQVIFFMTYLYYTTARCLQLDLPNSVLIPTVHDEPPIYLHCYDEVFSKAKGFVWLTSEEKAFAYQRFPGINRTPNVLAGIGLNEKKKEDAYLKNKLTTESKKIVACENYIIYLGRIAESKGCKELFSYFKRYKKQNPSDLKLILVGTPVMKIPNDPDILLYGFLNDEEKNTLLSNAKALVLHSRYESLSMVVLESMSLGIPVLVTGKCKVLRGHVDRSKAGFSFLNYDEYEKNLTELLKNVESKKIMSRNGRSYIRNNYRWEIVIEQYNQIINMISNNT